MVTKKKQTQTFPFCNYGNKEKINPPPPPIVLTTTPKKWIAIEFFLMTVTIIQGL
jgi:hypothetical protein